MSAAGCLATPSSGFRPGCRPAGPGPAALPKMPPVASCQTPPAPVIRRLIRRGRVPEKPCRPARHGSVAPRSPARRLPRCAAGSRPKPASGAQRPRPPARRARAFLLPTLPPAAPCHRCARFRRAGALIPVVEQRRASGVPAGKDGKAPLIAASSGERAPGCLTGLMPKWTSLNVSDARGGSDAPGRRCRQAASQVSGRHRRRRLRKRRSDAIHRSAPAPAARSRATFGKRRAICQKAGRAARSRPSEASAPQSLASISFAKSSKLISPLAFSPPIRKVGVAFTSSASTFCW